MPGFLANVVVKRNDIFRGGADLPARAINAEGRSHLQAEMDWLAARVRGYMPEDTGEAKLSVIPEVKGRGSNISGRVFSKFSNSKKKRERLRVLEDGRRPNKDLQRLMRKVHDDAKRRASGKTPRLQKVSWKGFGIPPPGSLTGWMARHGQDFPEFLKARAIAAYGLPAHHMFAKAEADYRRRVGGSALQAFVRRVISALKRIR